MMPTSPRPPSTLNGTCNGQASHGMAAFLLALVL